jgi:hypothetical protein
VSAATFDRRSIRRSIRPPTRRIQSIRPLFDR